MKDHILSDSIYLNRPEQENPWRQKVDQWLPGAGRGGGGVRGQGVLGDGVREGAGSWKDECICLQSNSPSDYFGFLLCSKLSIM